MRPDAPQRRGSIYAAEGTAAHALAETCLRDVKDADLYVGLEFEGFKVDRDMAAAVQVYLDHIRSLPFGLFWIEQGVSLSPLWENEGEKCPTPLFGTSDFLALCGDTLHVVDYKHGVGVPVEAKGNTQFMYYGLGGVYHALSVARRLPRYVTMTVVQPRAQHRAGPVRSWTIPTLDLFIWADTVLRPAVVSVLSTNTTYHAGTHCRWCPHAGRCPTLREKALETARTQFDDVTATPPAANLIPLDELGAILSQAELIVSWLSQVRAVVSDAIDKGHKIDGWKLVDKRAVRKWSDEDAVIDAVRKYFGSSAWHRDFQAPPKPLSPAQMEKTLKQKHRTFQDVGLDQFITSESSGTTLVPDEDERPAAATGPQAVFEDVNL